MENNQTKLKDILAISGEPGLYKFIAPGGRGIIVESISDGRRMNATGTAKVSSLAEISVFTDTDEMPLADVLTGMYEKTGGKEALSHKSPADQLKAFFGQAIPDYDRDRVHVSDMKKIISWYNLMVGSGMTDFSIEQPEEDPEQDQAAETADQ